MNHLTIITGPINSDKLKLAMQIAKDENFENIVTLKDPNFEDPFLYENCDKNTEMIIFENPRILIESYIRTLANDQGLIVNKKTEQKFMIHPKYVLTTSVLSGFLNLMFSDFINTIKIVEISIPKTPIILEIFIKEAVDKSTNLINELQEMIDSHKKMIEFSQNLCIHRHDDLSDAFEEVANTHKSIYKCSICGYTVTD